MSDLEHDFILAERALEGEAAWLGDIADRALRAAIDAQELAIGRHDGWMDNALRRIARPAFPGRVTPSARPVRASGETRTPTPFGHQDLNLARLPVPPRSRRGQCRRPAQVAALRGERIKLRLDRDRGNAGGSVDHSWGSRSRSSTISCSTTASRTCGRASATTVARCTSTATTPARSAPTGRSLTRRSAPPASCASFAIVHQAAPGLPVPVRVVRRRPRRRRRREGQRGERRADPSNVSLGMKVRLTTFAAGTDDEGTEAVAFGFEPVDLISARPSDHGSTRERGVSDE